MKGLKTAFLGGILVVIFVISCKRDDPSWDMDLTVPVAYGSLSLEDLLEDSITSVGADGSVRISSRTKIQAFADSLFNLPDTTIDTSYHWPLSSGNLSPGQPLVSNAPSQIDFGLNPMQLVSGILLRGKVIAQMQNDIQGRVIVTYELSSATIGGNPATITDTLPAAQSVTQPSFSYVEIDLAGYTVDFTGMNGDRVNTVVTVLSVIVDPSEPAAIPVVQADSVIISLTFSDLRPSYIRGYFGSEIAQVGPEETYLDFFSKIQSGTLGLDSITMTFTLENYAGVDARFTVNNLWSRSSRLAQTINLSHSLIGQPVNINRAFYSFSYPPSIPQIYSWQFNNANSNIVPMMELMPDYLGYDFTLWTNPLGNVSGNNDFLYPEFGINAFVDVDMPVNFFADQIVLVDTIETDFGLTDAAAVQNATLFLLANNGFPLDAGIQISLLDASNTVVSTIVPPPATIYSAPLSISGGYYFANGATSTMLNIPLNESQTQLFLNSSRVLLTATFNTNTNPNYVKIFTTNHLDFNLSADFEYRVNN